MKRQTVIFIFAAFILAVLSGSAFASGAIVVGDYVWHDANANGIQDEDLFAGVNGVRVDFVRDYDCNGFADGTDEYYDYAFTHDSPAGLPGYYSVPAIGGFCFVASLDASTIPEGLGLSTDPELSVVTVSYTNYLDADFGLIEGGNGGGGKDTWDVVIGDYVWFDANGNGLQDDGQAGINGVLVEVIRDYDCNGIVDGSDELYDYDYTENGPDGLPGWYSVIASSAFCYVAVIDLTTSPAGLVLTTPGEVAVSFPEPVDFLNADFGLSIPDAEFACPKTIGFWKQQFTDKKSAKYTKLELAALVEEAMDLSPVFGSARDFENALNSKGKEGPLARAKKQFAALALNFAAYNLLDTIGFPAGLGPNTPLDLPELTDAVTVGEAFDEIEFDILHNVNLEWANETADAINNGLGVDIKCDI